MRSLGLALGALLAFVVTLASLEAGLQRAEVRPPPLQADAGRTFDALIARIRTQSAKVDRQVLILGDSMLLKGGPDKPPDETIPMRLQRELRRTLPADVTLRVYPFAQPGAGYSLYYFFAERLTWAQPDAVVLEVNPSSLARSWRTGQWVRTDLVGWLGVDRLPEALALPLARLGLTADRLLWLVTCVELGCEKPWAWTQRQQLRVSTLYSDARASLNRSLVGQRGLRIAADLFVRGEHGSRFTARGYADYLDAYRGISGDDVSSQLLEAAVRRLRERGVETLVYVTPINVEHMRQLGIYDAEGIRETVGQLRAAVERARGRFLDLHDLLGDAEFRDAPGHLTHAGGDAGIDRVARALGSVLGPRLDASPAHQAKVP